MSLSTNLSMRTACVGTCDDQYRIVRLLLATFTIHVSRQLSVSIINPRHMREGYGSCSICLSVCQLADYIISCNAHSCGL